MLAFAFSDITLKNFWRFEIFECVSTSSIRVRSCKKKNLSFIIENYILYRFCYDELICLIFQLENSMESGICFFKGRWIRTLSKRFKMNWKFKEHGFCCQYSNTYALLNFLNWISVDCNENTYYSSISSLPSSTNLKYCFQLNCNFGWREWLIFDNNESQLCKILKQLFFPYFKIIIWFQRLQYLI